MAFFDNTAHGGRTTGGSFFDGIVAAVQRYVLMQRTYRELSALSDRELNDLGIGRGELRGIARRSAGYDA